MDCRLEYVSLIVRNKFNGYFFFCCCLTVRALRVACICSCSFVSVFLCYPSRLFILKNFSVCPICDCVIYVLLIESVIKETTLLCFLRPFSTGFTHVNKRKK